MADADVMTGTGPDEMSVAPPRVTLSIAAIYAGLVDRDPATNADV